MALSRLMANELPGIRRCLAKHPVEKAWMFGSCSRGEERPDSDVDFLVQYSPKPHLSLMDVARLYVDLHELLGREVDVVEDGCLLPFAVESANKDKILIYERTPQR